MSSAQSLVEHRPPSVAHLFLERVEATPGHEAYRFPVPVDDHAADGAPGAEQWRSLTWAQTAERVRAVAGGLMALGIQAEERVAIASSTRIEWILADLGVMCAGAATTTVYPSTNADETAFILSDAACRALFAEDAAQLAKAVAERDALPELAYVILFDAAGHDAAADTRGLTVLTLAELEERGAAHLREQPDAVEKAVQALDREQLATQPR